jgi:hypothetical protein
MLDARIRLGGGHTSFNQKLLNSSNGYHGYMDRIRYGHMVCQQLLLWCLAIDGGEYVGHVVPSEITVRTSLRSSRFPPPNPHLFECPIHLTHFGFRVM